MDTGKRILLIGATFIVVISILFFYVRVEYKDKYNITVSEIDGIQNITKIQNIDIELKKLRGLSQLSSNYLKYFKSTLNSDKIKTKVLRQINNINDKNIENLYNQINSTKNTLSKKEIFKKYSQIIQLLDAKRIDISDKSKLLFEPNRDMYFLMLLSVLDIHKITENIGYISGMGTFILSSNSKTRLDNELLKIRNKKAILLENIKDVEYSLSKLSSKESKDMRILLDSLLSDLHFLLNIKYYENDNGTMISVNNYFTMTSKFLNNIDNLFKISSETFILKLQEREKEISHKLLAGNIIYLIFVLTIIITTRLDYKHFKRDKLLNKAKKMNTDFTNLLISDYEVNSSLKQICDISLAHIINHFKALNGSLYIFDQDNTKLYLGSTYGIKYDSLSPTLDIHDNLISENILEKKIKVIDIKQDVNLGNVDVSGSKLVTIPILEFDLSIGTIQLCFDDSFNKTDTDFLQEVISLMATYINKAQQNYSSKRYLKLIDQNVLISKTDIDGNIIEVSEELCNLSQYTKEKLLGKTHRLLRHKDMKDETFKDMWETITKGDTWRGEIKNIKKDGSFYWVDSIISPDCDINGNIIGYTALRHDISDKKKIEEIAITDGLTSLFNRRHFDVIFPQEIKRNKRDKGLLVFVLMDIDHFKQYNDTYGHQGGDTTLIQVATTLKNTLNRPGDFTFRLGGEEFGLLYHVQQEEEALIIANKARVNIENINIEHTGNSASKYVTISSGLYIIDANDNNSPSDIYQKADDALYKAKKNGRNQVKISK